MPRDGLGTGPAATMLDIDVSGLAHVTEVGDRDRARARGHHVRAARRITRACTSSSAGTRSSPRTTPRCGSTACSSSSRAASCSTQPLYVRIANAVDGGSLFWRLLVVAEDGSRFTLIEEYASATPDRRRLLERRRRALRRARREARVRLAPEPLAARRGTSRRTTRASSATPSSTGSPAASARRRARSGSRTTSPARARRRA